MIKIHIVQQNETLESISQKYQITKETLAKLNPHINSLVRLQNGMKVKIPLKVKQPTVRQLNMLKKKRIEKHKPSRAQPSHHRVNHLYYRYAHAHRRPFGNMHYDQKASSQTEWSKLAIKQQSLCCHCQQPIVFSKSVKGR